MEHLQGMPVLPRHPGGRQVNRLARDPRMRPTLHIKNSKETKKELTGSCKSCYNKSDLVEAPGTPPGTGRGGNSGEAHFDECRRGKAVSRLKLSGKRTEQALYRSYFLRERGLHRSPELPDGSFFHFTKGGRTSWHNSFPASRRTTMW